MGKKESRKEWKKKWRRLRRGEFDDGGRGVDSPIDCVRVAKRA